MRNCRLVIWPFVNEDATPFTDNEELPSLSSCHLSPWFQWCARRRGGVSSGLPHPLSGELAALSMSFLGLSWKGTAQAFLT